MKGQINDNKWQNKPNTNVNHKIIIMFFFNLSKTSQNYPDKTFKVVLFECWFLGLLVVCSETKMMPNSQNYYKKYYIQNLLSSGKFQRQRYLKEMSEILMKYG